MNSPAAPAPPDRPQKSRTTESGKKARPRNEARKSRQPFDGKDKLYEVIVVRLFNTNRQIEVNVCDKRLMPNTLVLVRLRRNLVLAQTVGHRYRKVVEANSLPLIMRVASKEDLTIFEDNKVIEQRAHSLATQFAFSQKLSMKVLSADLSHDRKNITINFASDVRVDFREMVNFLASNLSMRIEMYQLGLRNGTGLLTGIGSCGQQLCCGRFLSQFDPVAVKLLKAQGLATNPKRTSGVCGRLFCCLSYEYNDFVRGRKLLPKTGRRILSRWGYGQVRSCDYVREEVIVNYDSGETQRLALHDFVLAPDRASAPNSEPDYVFPLEPARFFLNADPDAACEFAQTEGAPKQYSKPKISAVPKAKRPPSTQGPQAPRSTQPEPASSQSTSQRQRNPRNRRPEAKSATDAAPLQAAPGSGEVAPRKPAAPRKVHTNDANHMRGSKPATRQPLHREAHRAQPVAPSAQNSSSPTNSSSPAQHHRPKRNHRRRPPQKQEPQS